MKIIFRTLSIAAVIVVSACSTTKPESPALRDENMQVLSQQDLGKMIGDRAVMRWKNIIARKFDNAYELLSPGYRETHGKKEYAEVIANRPVHWTKATFVGHDCESADVCTIRVNIEFDVLMPSVGRVSSENVVNEKWIRIEDKWYFFPDNAGK